MPQFCWILRFHSFLILVLIIVISGVVVIIILNFCALLQLACNSYLMYLGLLCLAQTESLSYHSPIFDSSKYILWPNGGLKELLIIHHQQLLTVMTQRSIRLKSNHQHWVLMKVNFNFSFLVDVSLSKNKYIFTKPYQQKTDYLWNIIIHCTVKIGCSPLCLIFASQKFLTHVCIAVISKQRGVVM